ncbi:MAG: hypothetical protein J07HN6_00224, partial [Halonotius sp. J07HN6]
MCLFSLTARKTTAIPLRSGSGDVVEVVDDCV